MTTNPGSINFMLKRIVWCAVWISLIGRADFSCAAGGAKSAYWPQWRGAGRDDISTEKGLLQRWPEDGPAGVWVGTGLGDGYSSVVIENGRIYTTGDRKDGEY